MNIFDTFIAFTAAMVATCLIVYVAKTSRQLFMVLRKSKKPDAKPSWRVIEPTTGMIIEIARLRDFTKRMGWNHKSAVASISARRKYYGFVFERLS